MFTALLSFSTMAMWAGTREIVANPVSGSTVTEIKTLTLASADEDFPLIEVIDTEGISVSTEDATPVDCGTVKVNNYADPITVTFSNPITAPGTYFINFSRGTINMADVDYTQEVVAPEFNVIYVIEGENPGDQPGDEPAAPAVNLKIKPADGATVKALEYLTIVPADATTDWVETLDRSLISVKRDGADFSTVTSTEFGMGVKLTLKTPATQPGAYEVVFGDGALGDSNGKDIPGFTLHYTIAASASVEADPASGSTLTSPLTSVTVKSGDAAFPMLDILSADDIQVTLDGAPFCGVKVSGDEYGRILTLKQTPTESGTYRIIMPADSWEQYTVDPDYASRTSDVALVYNVQLPVASFNVEILPTKVNPNSQDGEAINLATYDGSLKTITFEVIGDGYYVNADATKAIASVVSARNGYSVSVPLRADAPKKKFSWDTQFTTRFYIDLDPAIVQNGTYTLSIPKGAFGTQAFVADNGTGSANKAFETTLVFTGGVEEKQPNVQYDLNIIGTKPAEGVVSNEYQWEVTSVYVAKEYRPRAGAQVSLTSADANYNVSGELRFGYAMTYNVLLFTNGKDPDYNGTYVLTIPQGTFGDAAWLANPDEGHSNPEIKVIYKIEDRKPVTTAVEVINADSSAPALYDLNGRYRGTDINSLPAGIYITKGRKVVK